MVRGTLLAILAVSISARAWAANPDCDRFKVNDSAKYLESSFNHSMSVALGCERNQASREREIDTIGYVLDLPGGEQSQIISAYYVVRCLDTDRMEDAKDPYLFCGYDARRLNEKKLDAEIAERKLSAESAATARALFKKAKDRDAWMVGELTKSEDKHYDYKKLYVDLPEQTAVAWEKFYADHKDVYDLGTAIERQLSATDLSHRGYQAIEVKGCDEMHKSFKDYLAKQSGKPAPEIAQFVQSDPLAFEMLSSIVACDGLRGFKIDAVGAYNLLEKGRMWRGPRTAAYWASLVEAKDTEAKVQFSPPVHKGYAEVDQHKLMHLAKEIANTNLNLSYGGPATAKVAAMKKLADGWVEVTFKLEKWMEPDFECVDIKPLHFNHWGQNGQPVWDWKCNVKGYHEETKQENPHAFSELASAGLKPGMVVKMLTASQSKEPTSQAFPLEVSLPAKTKKDKPKLISFSGIPLK